jgi:hypothetical protein
MANCPNCGEELPRSTGRIGTEIAHALQEAYGGWPQLGKALADELKNAEGPAKSRIQSIVMKLVDSEDKARARQKELEDFTRAQEKAILLEQALWAIEHDEEFRDRLMRVAEKRELIRIA